MTIRRTTRPGEVEIELELARATPAEIAALVDRERSVEGVKSVRVSSEPS